MKTHTISLYVSALLFSLAEEIFEDPSNRDNLVADVAAQTGLSVQDIEELLKVHPTQPRPQLEQSVVTARITRCQDGQPLVVLPDRPFNGLEVRPNDLERLGERLIAVAKLAKQHKGKRDSKVVIA